MNDYTRLAEDPAPIYRELYHKHNLGPLLEEAFVDEWHTSRLERRNGSVPWAAVVGIAAMLDVDPRTVTGITMEPRTLTVERVAFDYNGNCTGTYVMVLPIEQPKKL